MDFVRPLFHAGAFLLVAVASAALPSNAQAVDAGKPAVAVPADEPFVVAPSEVKLVGKLARAQLLATQTSADGKTSESSNDLTHTAVYSSDAPGVVQVTSQGQLLAQGNGHATVTVRFGKRSQTVKVEVVDADTAKVGFVHDVAPVLSKLGCNSASCHASQHGKGGFKLSVFGYAPDEDFRAMVREWQGRRSDLLEPEKSLILLKPLAAVPHGGNKRL